MCANQSKYLWLTKVDNAVSAENVRYKICRLDQIRDEKNWKQEKISSEQFRSTDEAVVLLNSETKMIEDDDDNDDDDDDDVDDDDNDDNDNVLICTLNNDNDSNGNSSNNNNNGNDNVKLSNTFLKQQIFF